MNKTRSPWIAKLHRLVKSCLCLVMLAITSCATPHVARTGGKSQPFDLPKTLAQLREEWAKGGVVYVSIVHVDASPLLRYDYSPSRLDAEATFTLAVRDPMSQKVTEELMEQIQKVTAHPVASLPAVRWGFIFCDAKGERVFSIYLQRTGRWGFINTSAVQFDSDSLFTWAESTFQSVF